MTDTTSAGTAHTQPAFTQWPQPSPIYQHATLMLTHAGRELHVAANADKVRFGDFPCADTHWTDTGRWTDLSASEAIATGHELLKAAGAPDKSAALREQRDELPTALQRLMRSFPTDSDMQEAQWEDTEINEACDAHDAARTLIARVTGA